MIVHSELGRLGRAALASCCLISSMLVGDRAQANAPRTELPVVDRAVVLKTGAEPGFLDDLAKFADAQAFAVRVGYPTPDREHVFVQMWREDMKLILTNPVEPNRFHIDFYQMCDFPLFKADFDKMMVERLGAVHPAIDHVE